MERISLLPIVIFRIEFIHLKTECLRVDAYRAVVKSWAGILIKIIKRASDRIRCGAAPGRHNVSYPFLDIPLIVVIVTGKHDHFYRRMSVGKVFEHWLEFFLGLFDMMNRTESLPFIPANGDVCETVTGVGYDRMVQDDKQEIQIVRDAF